MSHVNIFVLTSKYEPIELIGEGGFGEVYKVKDRDSGEIYAAKVSKYEVSQDVNNETTYLLFREVNVFSALDHPSIIKFIGYSKTNFENEPNPTLITEFAPRGSLQDIIETVSNSLSVKLWDDTKKLINIYGIASGMLYLHSNDIIHRDLKPGNILLDEQLHPKISDFGISKFTNLNFGILSASKPNKGTELYKPPEVQQGQEFTKAGDVYAFGLIVYQIMENNPDISGGNSYTMSADMVFNKKRPKFSDNTPKPYRQLIAKCWDQDPENRPTFGDIIKELKKYDFITETVDEDAFYNYVEFLDDHIYTLNIYKHSINFNEFIHGKKNRNRSNEIRGQSQIPLELIQNTDIQIESQDDYRLRARRSCVNKFEQLVIEIDQSDSEMTRSTRNRSNDIIRGQIPNILGKIDEKSQG